MWEDEWSAPVNDAPKQVVRVCVREENAVGSLTCLARHTVDLKSIAECGTYMRISAWIFFLGSKQALGTRFDGAFWGTMSTIQAEILALALEEVLAL